MRCLVGMRLSWVVVASLLLTACGQGRLATEAPCPTDEEVGDMSSEELNAIPRECDEAQERPTDAPGVTVGDADGSDPDGNSTLESVTAFRAANWNDPGSIGHVGDVDWYGLQVESEPVQVEVVGISGADVDLTVRDIDGEVIADSRKRGKESESVRLDLPRGRYYVVVLPKDRSSSGGGFRVEVTAIGSGR